MRLKYLLFILFGISLWGCSKSAYKQSVKVYRKNAKVLKTRGVTDNVFHKIALQNEISPAFDGVLLAFEDVPRNRVASKRIDVNRMLSTYGLSMKAYTDNGMQKQEEASIEVLRDGNVQALTHIVTAEHGSKTKYYNVYDKKDLFAAEYDLYRDTKLQLDKIKGFLENKIKQESDKQYTHIVLMSTGWNNDQQKSVFHYNSWLNNIDSASANSTAFNPLYICITWPSYTRNGISYLTNESFVPFTFVDFFENQKDADELGMTHINYLLWKILVPISTAYNKPLVLLGHSFGARILTRASYSSVLFTDKVNSSNKIDLLMSFQGAYRISRHLPVASLKKNRNDDGIYTLSNPAKNFVATVSEHDGPMNVGSKLYRIPFMGDERTIGLVNKKGYKQFDIGSVTEAGGLEGNSDSVKQLILECSEVIGGHHDVTNVDMGKLIWALINKK